LRQELGDDDSQTPFLSVLKGHCIHEAHNGAEAYPQAAAVGGIGWVLGLETTFAEAIGES
jgi:hypothetical protein